MGTESEDFFSSITEFDNSKDYQGLVGYLTSQPWDINAVSFSVYRLLTEKRYQVAYIISKVFINSGFQHSILQFAQAIGGLTFGNADDEAQGTASLATMMDHISPEQYMTFYNQVMAPSLFSLTESALMANDHGKLMRLLDILKAGSPRFRNIFDFSDEAPVPTLADIRRRGHEQAKLIKFANPPAGSPRPVRHAVIAIRELFFPQNQNSRPIDTGPRLYTAMNNYGWRTTFYPMKWGTNLSEDYRAIAEICEREQADLLVFDDHLIEHASSHQPRAQMIEHIRQTAPSLKIVALQLDSWVIDPGIMINAAASVDTVWAFSPSLSVWDHPVFADKVLQLPVPHAGNFIRPNKPLSSRIVFDGTLKGYNWHRVFWWAASLREGLPIDWYLSHHMTDGLSALDSYASYMNRLSDRLCSLSLSMRPNLSLVLTGRVFESFMSGTLLVQEASPDMDYYFISGEHYLSFSTFSELRAIGRFIAERSEEAEEIRRAGNEFAFTHYSDDKLIGYLDKHLFYPDH